MEALRGADLTHAEYRVAATLWTYARADLTNARPGPATLREDARVNEKTLKKALRVLVAKGWIQVTEQGGSERGGPRRATVYALAFPTGGSEYPGSDPETGGSEYPGSEYPTGGSEYHDRGYSVPRPGVLSTDDRGYSVPPHQGIDQGRTGEDHSPGRAAEVASTPHAATSNDPAPAAVHPTPPPRRCRAHVDTDTPPSCGPCGDARRAREAWDREHAQRHAEQAKQQRAADRAAAAAVRAAAVSACGLCDADGYVGTVVCDHDPGAMRRPGHGAALFAAEQANRRQAERAAITDADKDALCPACSLPLGTTSAKRGIHADCANRSATPAPTGRL